MRLAARPGSFSAMSNEASIPWCYLMNSDMVFGTHSRFRRQDFQGCEACRPAGRTTDQVRAGDQFEDRQGTRPHLPALLARPPRPRDLLTPMALSDAYGAQKF